MCGIFGIVSSNLDISKDELLKQVTDLFILSEARGKEAAGLAIKYDGKLNVYKDKVTASEMLKESQFNKFYTDSLPNKSNITSPISIFGHSRLVTNGSAELNYNNQPVVKDGLVAIHNGICTNVDLLFYDNVDIKREFEIDTEIILSLIRKNLNTNDDLVLALKNLFESMEGTASLAIATNDSNNFIITTNNGSLYLCFDNQKQSVVFASEKYILSEYIKKHSQYSNQNIEWVKPLTGYIIDNTNFTSHFFDLNIYNLNYRYHKTETTIPIKDYSNFSDKVINIVSKDLSGLLNYDLKTAHSIKRCTKCLLPHTFPFISFDSNGVCVICNNYIKKNQGKKEQDLQNLVNKYKNSKSVPDCLIAFSGGRDSSYGMHYIVKELGLKPITYTYDWGMVTDLARRNIARICGKLGVENILVSADLKMKRNNIRLNVAAWLKRPELGMIPLFMAGDKHFFQFMNKIKSETGLHLNIWSMNRLENTDFKSGFCGIKHNFDKKRIDYLSLGSQATMLTYYFKNFLLNPGYLNSSIPDTISSYYSYYAEPRNDYVELFDYIAWDEKTIEDTIINEYNWETSPDTMSTWRIGDGTAAFYNYIYLTVAGFTENDTFRSNQIREGMITREEGLRLALRDNSPRYDSIKWYFDTIGIDMESAIKTINNIPKLYQPE